MRYLKATVLIGTISAALTIILFAAGWISTTPDLVLREKIYQMSKPFIIPDGAQLVHRRPSGFRRGVDDGGHHPAGPQGGRCLCRHFSAGHRFTHACALQCLLFPVPRSRSRSS